MEPWLLAVVVMLAAEGLRPSLLKEATSGEDSWRPSRAWPGGRAEAESWVGDSWDEGERLSVESLKKLRGNARREGGAGAEGSRTQRSRR